MVAENNNKLVVELRVQAAAARPRRRNFGPSSNTCEHPRNRKNENGVYGRPAAAAFFRVRATQVNVAGEGSQERAAAAASRLRPPSSAAQERAAAAADDSRRRGLLSRPLPWPPFLLRLQVRRLPVLLRLQVRGLPFLLRLQVRRPLFLLRLRFPLPRFSIRWRSMAAVARICSQTPAAGSARTPTAAPSSPQSSRNQGLRSPMQLTSSPGVNFLGKAAAMKKEALKRANMAGSPKTPQPPRCSELASPSIQDLSPDTREINSQASKRKRRKLISDIWKEAKPIYKDGQLVEGKCNHCSQIFAASRDSGTSHMKRHLKMQSKFKQYWKETYMSACIPVILDPRYKYDLMEYLLSDFGTEKEAETIMVAVKKNMEELFKHYSKEVAGESHTDIATQEVQDDNDPLAEWDQYMKSKRQQSSTELDQYLKEHLTPRKEEVDILQWWKARSDTYPVLSRIARDVLAIPASTVPSESAFSTGGRVVSDYRSSLAPTTIEALICLQDWFKAAYARKNDGISS